MFTDRLHARCEPRCDDLVIADSSLVTYRIHLRHNESVQIDTLNDGQELGDSMLEEIRRTVERRLHEIEPLLEEAKRLRDILDVIEGHSQRQSETTASDKHALERELTRSVRNASSLPESRDGRHKQVSRSQGGAAERAAKGSNKRTILALVADRPGITAAEIAAATGMKRTVVASTVSRLKRYGELAEHESGGVCVPATSPETSGTAAAVFRRTSARPRRRQLNTVQTRRAA